MDISEKSKMIDKIKSLVVENKKLLEGFEEIYIFGSVLCTESCPKDIDILLIYAAFETDLIEKRENIGRVFEKEMDLPVDITMLSCVEKDEVNFLALIKNKYERIIW